MTKLPQNSLQNIEMKELKALLKQNKAISGFSDFVRDYIGDILKNEGKFEEKDFENLKINIKKLNTYSEKFIIVKNNYSYELIDSLKNIYDLKELEVIKDYLFNKYYNDDSYNNYYNIYNDTNNNERNDINFITNANSKNIIFLLNLYKIKNKYELNKLCENESIVDLLIEIDNNVLLFIIEKFNINSTDNFESFCENKKVTNVLKNVKLKNLKFVFKLYDIKSINDLEKIFKDKKLCDYLINGNEKNWEYLIEYLDIDNIDKFERLYNNHNTSYFLKCIKKENLKYILNIYKISSIREFRNLCTNMKLIEFLLYAQEENFKNIATLYQFENKENFENILNNSNIKEILKYAKKENLDFFIKNFDTKTSKNIIENISYDSLNKVNINRIKYNPLGVEIGLFIENIINPTNDFEKLDLNVNKGNFLDFMNDKDCLFEFSKDYRTKLKGTKIWSKKWFLEDVKRINYIEKETIELIEKIGTYNFLHQKNDLKGINKIHFGDPQIKKYIGDEMNLIDYISLKSENHIILRLINKDEFHIIESKIGKISLKQFKLLNSYLKENGVSEKYFFYDLLNICKNKEKIDFKIILKLFKHKIYPTINTINFIENGGNYKDLENTKKTYKKEGNFDINNIIHTDLEYIDFRYIIDNATNYRYQEDKSYDNYLNYINEILVSKNKKFNRVKKHIKDKIKEVIISNLDMFGHKHCHYVQAAKEAYIAKSFIDFVKQKNDKINVFSNLSYGKVVSGAFRKELEKDKKVNFNHVRIGSTECHGDRYYIKLELFSKKDIKNLFLGDSIILDGTSNSSVPDSNIGFKTYFYVLNKALSEILNDKSFIDGYEKSFIDEIEKEEDYYKLVNYLKSIIINNNLAQNAKKFNFLYVSQNNNVNIKTRGEEKKYLDQINETNNSINVYFADFVERIGDENGQAYFDDTEITKFSLNETNKGFDFIDNNFESELIKEYNKIAKEGTINCNFNIYKNNWVNDNRYKEFI